MKERELVRIPDEREQRDMAKTIITAHNELLRNDRMGNPERFTFQRSYEPIEEPQPARTAFRKRIGASQSNAGRSEMDIQTSVNPSEIKQVQVKTANKQIRGLRQGKKDGKGGFGATDDDNDEITFDYVLSDIVGSTLANKMGKNDPEYKNFKESFDQVTTYFIDRYSYISDELIHDVFSEVIARAAEIVGVVSKNMMDFSDLAEFFSQALRKTNPVVTSAGSTEGENAEETSIFELIVDAFRMLGNRILNEDPQQTELFFLEYALDDLLEIMCENDFKRSLLSKALYAFSPSTANARLRVLRRVKSKIATTNKDQFVAIINDLLELDEIEEG